MNNTYTESKKVLDKIRAKYGCKGEVIFASALMQVVEDGKERLNDKDLVDVWMEQIEREHREAEAKGEHLWVSEEFEKAIIECAAEIAKVRTIDIIIYMQKEWLFGEWYEMTYSRAIKLLKYVVGHTLQDGLTEDARNELDCYGIDDTELEFLGFGDYLNEEDN